MSEDVKNQCRNGNARPIHWPEQALAFAVDTAGAQPQEVLRLGNVGWEVSR